MLLSLVLVFMRYDSKCDFIAFYFYYIAYVSYDNRSCAISYSYMYIAIDFVLFSPDLCVLLSAWMCILACRPKRIRTSLLLSHK